MNLNGPIYSTLLHNKFLNLVVVLVDLRFGRPRDQTGSGCSGMYTREFAQTPVVATSCRQCFTKRIKMS